MANHFRNLPLMSCHKTCSLLILTCAAYAQPIWMSLNFVRAHAPEKSSASATMLCRLLEASVNSEVTTHIGDEAS